MCMYTCVLYGIHTLVAGDSGSCRPPRCGEWSGKTSPQWLSSAYAGQVASGRASTSRWWRPSPHSRSLQEEWPCTFVVQHVHVHSLLPSPWGQGSSSCWRSWNQSGCVWEGTWGADGWRTRSSTYPGTTNRNNKWTQRNGCTYSHGRTMNSLNMQLWNSRLWCHVIPPFTYTAVRISIAVNQSLLQCFLIRINCSRISELDLGRWVTWQSARGVCMALVMYTL